ncbi:MAG: histidine kinase [Verrucomicrobium sp.]
MPFFCLSPQTRPCLKALVFFLASSLAVCFPLALGKVLWPQGLSAGAEYIFWLASGVNLGAVLLLGWRYAFVILLDALPAVFILGEPWDRSVSGALGNCVEALLAWWMIMKLGKFLGTLARLRPVLVLVAAAFFAPLAGSLLVPAVLVSSGRFAPGEFWMAVGNWNLANGAAMLVLAPLIVTIFRGGWSVSLRRWSTLLWIFAGLGCGWLAFDAVFEFRAVNFAFLIFPFVILVAVRYGPAETSASLLLAMACIYLSMATHASGLIPTQAPALIWFLQACLWVLAATGYVVAAVVEERRDAEGRMQRERNRVLEASLREERARLEALRYQIHPHFLFNSLNSVRATLPEDAVTSREMVSALADFLRTSLEGTEGETIRLAEEMGSVSRYLSIEQIRFGDRLQYAVRPEPGLEGFQVPPFILQPLVENALKHGSSQRPELLVINLEAARVGEAVRLSVSNNGQWKEPGVGMGGLGLSNVRRRLEILYGGHAAVEAEETSGNVSVILRFPPGTSPDSQGSD